MSLRREAISGALWTYGQQFGTQFVGFLVSIVLARLLMPEEFGLIGMIAIFMSLGIVLFDGGMTSSLIRTADADSLDFSTVFIFNIGISILAYILVYLAAPFIADFYNEPSLTAITRVYSLSFIISAFGSVQNTKLTKEMQFKKQTILGLPALLISSATGLVLAYMGFGVWALVYMGLCNALVMSVSLWISSSWKPSTKFSREKFRIHFGFGYKLTLSGILDAVFTNLYQIVIGRIYAPATVGYYTRSNSLMMLPVGNISTALNKVALPLFSKVQHEPERLREIYKKIQLLVLFLIVPIIVLMATLAEPLVVFLFTDKWLAIVPIFKVICVAGILYPLHMYNLLILQIKGRSDLFLKLEIVKKVLAALILAVSLIGGLYALLWGQVVLSVLSLVINTHYAGRMINYSFLQQVADILPIFVVGALTAVLIYFLRHYFLADSLPIVQLLLLSLIGAVTYTGLSFLFRVSSLLEVKNILLKRV